MFINIPTPSSAYFYRVALLFLIVLLIHFTGHAQFYHEKFENGIRKPPWNKEGYSETVSKDVSLSGNYSFKAYLPAQTYSKSSGGNKARSEIRWTGGDTGTPNHHPHFTTWGIKLAMYVPENFKPDKTSVESIFQFHGVKDPGDSHTNPPFMVRIKNTSFTITNRWISKKISTNADQHTKTWSIGKNVVPGKWHYFVVDVHWDYREGGNGWLKVYMNIGSPADKGDLVVNYTGPTGYNNEKGCYFKMGVYKWDWTNSDRVKLSKSVGVTERLYYYDDYMIQKGGFFGGSGGTTSTSTTTTTSSTGSSVTRINAGGGSFSYSGNQYIADKYFSGGNTLSRSISINNTSNDKLYRSERHKTGTLTYNINVPKSGEYMVKLHFAEINRNITKEGVRVFNINIEGQKKISNFDIIQAAGAPATAVVKSFTGVKVTDGKMTITFTAVKGGSSIAGIEVISESTSTMAAQDLDIVSAQTEYAEDTEDMFPREEFQPFVKIYPNPVVDFLSFEMYLENPEEVDLKLYDSVGKLYTLGRLPVSSGHSKFTYNIEELNLSPGLYYLKVTSQQLDSNPIKIALAY